MQIQYSVRELAVKQEKYCATCNLGLTTKLTNAVHTKKKRTPCWSNYENIIRKMVSKICGKELGI